jgi:hypothetical protein
VHGRTALRQNLFTHLTAAVVVPGCLALGWWQVTRALAGNTLSWAYVFEWPIFAGYAVFMWWKLTHDRQAGAAHGQATAAAAPDPRLGHTAHSGAHGTADTAPDRADAPAAGRVGDRTGTPDEVPRNNEEDEALASYNEYLAALNASGRRKHW